MSRSEIKLNDGGSRLVEVAGTGRSSLANSVALVVFTSVAATYTASYYAAI